MKIPHPELAKILRESLHYKADAIWEFSGVHRDCLASTGICSCSVLEGIPRQVKLLPQVVGLTSDGIERRCLIGQCDYCGTIRWADVQGYQSIGVFVADQWKGES